MTTTMNDQPAALPPIPVPSFLRSEPLKVWRSPAGIWFLRSETLQTGGILRMGTGEHDTRWILYTPCDFDEWAGILQSIADGLQALVGDLAHMQTANARPT